MTTIGNTIYRKGDIVTPDAPPNSDEIIVGEIIETGFADTMLGVRVRWVSNQRGVFECDEAVSDIRLAKAAERTWNVNITYEATDGTHVIDNLDIKAETEEAACAEALRRAYENITIDARPYPEN